MSLLKGQTMDTLHQAPVITPEPLPDRVRIAREAVDEASAWYAGGLDPEPWAA